MNIWIEIAKLTGQTVTTISQRKPIDIVGITGDHIVVRPHKNQEERPIPRKAIENAYKRLVAVGEISRNEISLYFSEWSSAYVAAILAALPGVKHSKYPIRLSIK